MSSQSAKAMQWGAERRRRRFPRFQCDFAVSINLFLEGERRVLEGHCRDLAEAGIGVLIAAEVPLGEVVSLGFTLPALAHGWEIRAVLRQRRGYHYGFEFLALSAVQLEELQRYLPQLKRADSD